MPPQPGLFTKIGLFPSGNVKVTTSQPNQSRSESTVAVNPLNPNNLIAASKNFIDPQKYQFTLSTSWSDNGAASWQEPTPGGKRQVLIVDGLVPLTAKNTTCTMTNDDDYRHPLRHCGETRVTVQSIKEG